MKQFLRSVLRIIAVSALLLTGGGCAQENEAVSASEPVTVLLFGDSNTFGYMPLPMVTHIYRYPYEQRWPVITAKNLGSGYQLVTDGLMGRTVNQPHAFFGDSKRGTCSLPNAFAENLPIDILVIMLGTNDCLIEQNMTAEGIAQDMRHFLDETRKLAEIYQGGYMPEIILVSPPLIRSEWRDSISNLEGTSEDWERRQELNDESVEKSAALAGLYEQIAEDYNCIFVDAGVCEVSETDCIHLTEQGHAQLAKLVTDAVQSAKLSDDWLAFRSDMIGGPE